MKLLLLSTSTVYGTQYLDYAEAAVRAHFGPAPRRILFVPFALHDRAAYAAKAAERLGRLGYEVESAHAAPGGARAALTRTQGVFIGGGNTFRLLNELYAGGWIEPLRERVRAGLPYMGASAGTNVACASIHTTNDMPIVYPPSFKALGFLPFNVNPHYLDPEPGSQHMGETREQRIREFHEECARPVLGLREGAWLELEGGELRLAGTRGARLFRRGQDAQELASGARLDALLEASA